VGALSFKLDSGEVGELDAMVARMKPGKGAMIQNIFQTS
jgi:hypothetical protein